MLGQKGLTWKFTRSYLEQLRALENGYRIRAAEIEAFLDECLGESALDGEIVIARDGQLDFEALLLRIHPAASRVALLAEQTPASFVAWDLLTRTRRTLAQSGLDAGQRRRNIRGAFACRRRNAIDLTGARVAIVDDVMTTGATLAECCRTLQGAGAAGISLWVAARAPPG